MITGTLAKMTRREAADLIEGKGGRVTSQVSGSTHYLLAGDKAGSKLDKARKLGVSIISLEDLRNLID